MSHRRTAACLLVLLGSMSFLSACGSGEDPTPTGGASTVQAPQREPEPTDPPAVGFRDTSGVTDIPAFGLEASVAQRTDAQRVLSSYLNALEEGKWQRACNYLSVIHKGELLALIARLEQVPRKTCAEAVRVLSEQASTEGDVYRGRAPIGALRIEEGGGAGAGAGFALFHGDDGNDYWMTMRLEGGEWKVGSSIPQRLR